MIFIFRQIRIIILLVNGAIALFVLPTRYHLTYSFLALIYLYLSLLPCPLYSALPSLPFKGLFIKARRAIGMSAFLFSGLHGYFSVINITGISLGVSLGSFAFIILFLMALTSFNKMIALLGPTRWKNLHRFVYLAGVFIMLHVYWVGPHFTDRFSAHSILFLIALVILFSLEAVRFKKYLSGRFH